MDKLQTTDKLPRYIQVHSTLEFTRLVCALERAPRVSFLHDYDGKKILSVQMDVLKEKPVHLNLQAIKKSTLSIRKPLKIF